MANNLKALRKRKGFTQEDLARAMGTSRDQLAKLESGARRLSNVWIDRAAHALAVDPADLVREHATIEVSGTVATSVDGATITYGTDDGKRSYVRAPYNSTRTTVALEVQGSPMRGVAEDGWFIFYDDRADGFDEDLLGELCVVGLHDERTLIRFVQRGRIAGHYDLESHNASTIRDAQIAWSAPVTCIVPRRFAAL